MTTDKSREDSKSQDEDDVPVLCSQRWILAYISCLGFGIIYALRVNISVAVVCMIRTVNTTSSDDVDALNGSSLNGTCASELKAASESNDGAELEWNSTTKSTILAAFFYGYICTQVLGGWMAFRFGGKRVLGIAIFLSSLLTLAFPVCARTSVYLVYTIRVLLGLLTGVSFPAMHSMWGRWAPPLERSKLTTLCYAGTTIGNVLTFSTSGLLCAYGFDNGWASIFYITGLLGVLWTVGWVYTSADTPTVHPRITEAEKKYITGNLEYSTERKSDPVPWRKILVSPKFIAILVAHICNNWTNYTLLTNIPTFMKEVLLFDIKQNGVLSAVPYLCQFVVANFAGHLADFLRSRNFLNTTNTRKLMMILSFGGSGLCLIGTGFCTCANRPLAVGLLSLAVAFTGFCRAGYMVSHVDIAPKYAGVLFGMTNTVATIPGMVAPIVAGALTPNNTPEEWRNVFYLCAAIAGLGLVTFTALASGELQDWAKDDDVVVEVNMSGKQSEVPVDIPIVMENKH